MREITKEQFSTGSTIDGRRIDKAMEDIVDRANSVEKRDLSRRFVQVQYCGGFTPNVGLTANDASLPFMPEINASPLENEYRVKGTRRFSQSTYTQSHVYTATHFFRKPVIIIGVNVNLMTGGTDFGNDFMYGEGAVSDLEKADNQYSDDVTISISVDNPFLPERRELNSEVYHRHGFALIGHKFNQSVTAAAVDMAPSAAPASSSNPIPAMAGIVIDDQDINIPLPRDSRVRFSVVIPDYSSVSSDVSGWGEADGSLPWNSQVMSWTLTVLEGVEK